MTLPGRGELVGRAYVQILADAKALNREIKEHLERQGEKFDKQGESDADKYAKSFRRNLERGEYGRALGRVLERSAKNVKASGSALGEEFNAAFVAKMTGKNLRIGEILEKDIRDNFNLEDLIGGDAARLERILRTRLVSAERQFAAETAKATKEFEAQVEAGEAIDRNMKLLVSDFRRRQTAAENVELQRQKLIREAITDQTVLGGVREREAAAAATKARWDAVRERLEQFRQETAAHEENARRGIELDRNMAALAVSFRRRQVLDQERAYDTYASNIARITRASRGQLSSLNRVSTALNRVNTAARNAGISNPFPRSRWLRPVGSIISLASRIPGILTNIATKAVDAGIEITQAFATDGIKAGFKALFGNLASLIGGGIASLAGLAAAFALIILIAGPVAAAISAIAGAITALVASVSLGLIGAVGAAAPFVLALAAAAGVLFLAFKGGTDVLNGALTPFKEWGKTAQKMVRDRIFPAVEDALGALAPALERVNPLLDNSAESIGKVIRALGQKFSSEGFLANLAPLQDPTTGIPALIEKLGTSIGLFFSGGAGVITALLPVAQKLADNIQDVATRFDAFANSDKGQNKIKDFFDKAWGSAQQLGRVIGAAWGVLAETFNSGQETGDGFLASITSSLDRFKKFVEDGGLEDWFKDAKKFITDMGPLLDELAGLFQSLVTPEAKKRLSGFMDTLGDIIGVVSDSIKWIERITNAFIIFVKFLSPVTAPLFAVVKLFQLLAGLDWGGIASGIASGLVAGLKAAWGAVTSFFSGLWTGLVNAVKGILGIHSPSTVFRQIGIDILQGLLDGLLGLVGGVLGFFADLPGRIIGALGDLGGLLLTFVGAAFSLAWEGVKSLFNGDFLSFVGGIGLDILTAIGDLAADLIGKFVGAFTDAKNATATYITDTFLPWVRGIPESIGNKIAETAGSIASALIKPFENAYNGIVPWVNKIISAYNSIPFVGDVDPLQRTDTQALGNGGDRSSGGRMRGGWVTQPGMYGGAPIGERYLKELVVPMELPLSQVNPDVRWAAELLRNGPKPKGNMTGGVVGGGTPSLNFAEGAFQISGVSDPVIAAHAAVDQFFADVRL